MAASLSGLSASVTRILFLTGFPKELKTKDIQSAFSEYEGVNGGFKIKWKDDTSLLIVFQDAAVAKRAYLNTVAFPPAILTSPSGVSAIIRPYDGPDAQTVIQNVNARGQHNPHNASRSHNARSASVSVFPTTRTHSNSSANPNNAPQLRLNQGSAPNGSQIPIERSDGQPSPTLPSLPSHPTLNALISSSLGEAVAGTGVNADPAILATSLQQQQGEPLSGPRIGDPGKRMLGAALGVRHPSLGQRVINGNSNGNGNPSNQGKGVDSLRDLQRGMGGLVVAE
jgi:hypothetical protein